MMEQVRPHYYVSAPSFWPILGCVGLFLVFFGAAHWLHDVSYGPYVTFLGLLVVLLMLFGWLGKVIQENRSGVYTADNDRAFRWGMTWFIFSEVLFFAALFGAFFFVRLYSVPQLGGDIRPITDIVLWPDFLAQWPLMKNPDNTKFLGPETLSSPWGVPALNTLILLSSAATITLAHWGLRWEKRWLLVVGLFFTVVLGATFLYFQAGEYHEAYVEHGLTLNSGAYGSLFFCSPVSTARMSP